MLELFIEISSLARLAAAMDEGYTLAEDHGNGL